MDRYIEEREKAIIVGVKTDRDDAFSSMMEELERLVRVVPVQVAQRRDLETGRVRFLHMRVADTADPDAEDRRRLARRKIARA